jgi:hypothetical protein
MWRNPLIALASVALLALGLGIIVYVGLAHDRIVPTPIPAQAALTLAAPSEQPAPSETSGSPVQVKGHVREYAPGALIMVIVPSEGQIEQIIMLEDVQIVWADGRRAAPQDISPGQALSAEGTLDALGRLIASQITISPVVTRPSATPPAPTSVAPTPKPTLMQATSVPPTATRVVRAWRGEYYGNESLDGAPIVVRTDATLDFDWQLEAPASGVPQDSFSVRWRGRWPFEEGDYRFNVYSDDGARLWVNGIQVINRWQDQSATLAYGDLRLQAGEYDVQVDYYDALGNARIHVWWERVPMATPSPTSQPTNTALPSTPTFTTVPPTTTPTLTRTPIPASATPTPTRTAVPHTLTPTSTLTPLVATATATLTHTVGITPSSTRHVVPSTTLTELPMASPSVHPSVSNSPSIARTSTATTGVR